MSATYQPGDGAQDRARHKLGEVVAKVWQRASVTPLDGGENGDSSI
jgi:hypothetical protein